MYGTSLLVVLALGSATPGGGFYIRFEVGFEKGNPCENAPYAQPPCSPVGYPGVTPPGYNQLYAPPRAPALPAVPTTPAETLPLPKREDATLTATRRKPARLHIQVPPNTRLYIDGHPKETVGGQGTFTTPPLQCGETYYYTLRAVVVCPEGTFTEDKRLLVRAGEVIQVVFPEPASSDIVRVSVVVPARR